MATWTEIPASEYVDGNSNYKREVDVAGHYVDQNGNMTSSSTHQEIDVPAHYVDENGNSTSESGHYVDNTHSNMSFNGKTPEKVTFNGIDAKTVYFNGTKVFWHTSDWVDYTYVAATYKDVANTWVDATYKYYKLVATAPTIEIVQDETSTTATDGVIGIAGTYTIDSDLAVSSIVVTIGGISAQSTYSNGLFSVQVTQNVKSGSFQAIATITDSAGQTASNTWYGEIQSLPYEQMSYLVGAYGNMSGNFYKNYSLASSGTDQTYTLSMNYSGTISGNETSGYITNGDAVSYGVYKLIFGTSIDESNPMTINNSTTATVKYKRTKNGTNKHPIGEVVTRTDNISYTIKVNDGKAYVTWENTTRETRSKNYVVTSTKFSIKDTWTFTGRLYEK